MNAVQYPDNGDDVSGSQDYQSPFRSRIRASYTYMIYVHRSCPRSIPNQEIIRMYLIRSPPGVIMRDRLHFPESIAFVQLQPIRCGHDMDLQTGLLGYLDATL